MVNTRQHFSLTKRGKNLEDLMESNKHLIGFLNSYFLDQIDDNCSINDQVTDDKIKIFFTIFNKTKGY